MTEPVLKCRTDAYFEAIRDRDAIIADRGATIADQNAIIAEYKRLYGDLPKHQSNK